MHIESMFRNSWVIKALLPPDRGIFIVFVIPIICGLAITNLLRVSTIVSLVASFSLLCVRSLVLYYYYHPKPAGEGGRKLLSFLTAIFSVVAIACGLILAFIYNLFLIIPIGLIVSFFLGLNVYHICHQKNKHPLAQLTGVAAISSNAFIIPYVTYENILTAGMFAWFFLTIGFAVSIFNMEFKTFLQRSTHERISSLARGQYGFPSIIGNIGLLGISLILLTSDFLPSISFISTVLLVCYSISSVFFFPSKFLVDYKDLSELAGLTFWGCGVALGFLG